MQLGSLPIINPTEIVDPNPIGQVNAADLEWMDDMESRIKKLEQMQNILMFALLIVAIIAITKK
jgi:hypothetical protein